MDGVIVDSTEAHIAAWRRYLEGFGIEIADIEARMLGRHNDEIVRDFFSGHCLSATEIIDHGARKEELYRELMGPVCQDRLVPGVTDFLRAHAHVPAGVASNAEKANVELVLERAGIRSYFQAVVNGHNVQRPKPAPDIYLKAASLLKADSRVCIVFEDSLTGVQAARAAGMRVVGLTTTIPEFPDIDLAIRDFNDPKLRPWLHAVSNSE